MAGRNDIQLIREAYIRMYEGMITKDEAILRDVLDDSFVLVHMTGMRQSKTAFLKAVENGTLNYASAEHEAVDVTVHGASAVLSGKSRVCAAVFGGGWHTWRLRQDLRLVRKDERWLITLSEAGTY